MRIRITLGELYCVLAACMCLTGAMGRLKSESRLPKHVPVGSGCFEWVDMSRTTVHSFAWSSKMARALAREG